MADSDAEGPVLAEEYIGGNEGYTLRRSHHWRHGAVTLLDRDGKPIATVYGVHEIVLGALDRKPTSDK